jgi:hypothetical protein
MATALTVNDIVRIRINTVDSDEIQIGINTIYYKVASIVGTPDYQTLADALSARFATPYKNWMSTNTTYWGVTAQRAFPRPFSQTYFSDAGRGAGVGPSFTVPNQVSGLINFYSETPAVGATGKTYFPQGRIFVPFPTIAFVVGGGKLTAGGVAALETIRASIGQGINVAQGAGVSSFMQLVILPVRTLVPVLSTVSYASARWATQKKRSERGRQNAIPY